MACGAYAAFVAARWSLSQAVLIVVVVGTVAGACTRPSSRDESEERQTPVTESLATSPAESTTTSTTGAAVPPPAGETGRAVGMRDGEVVDTARDRTVPYRVFAPLGAVDPSPVVLISHGGFGSDRGYTTANHFGEALAAAGFVSIHVGHRESVPPASQLSDRPADATFVLDLAADGALDLPDGFGGSIDVAQVGHLGHSFGAYTAYALAGAMFRQGGGSVSFADPRIAAIVVLSPQGVGQFGAFADADGTTTWSSVDVPVLGVAGSLELDTNALGEFRDVGWRLQPFELSPRTADSFMLVIDGAHHSDLWRTGGADLERWLADQVVEFFAAYLVGSVDADACSIGSRSDLEGDVDVERRTGSNSSRLTACD